jgi:quercetin dioxygenase-like cupin family protein
MAIRVELEVPGMTQAGYHDLLSRVGEALARAPGLLVHSGHPAGAAWRVEEVWQSEADWSRFVETHVAPALRASGLQPAAPRIAHLDRVVSPVDGKGVAVDVGPLGPDEGKRFRLGPLEILVREDGSGTRGRLAVGEFRGVQYRIPPHKHTEHDENIHVLEGEMGVMLGDRQFTATAGTSFTIPVGIKHSIWNESGKLCRFLNMIAPARYLDYFHEMAAASTAGLPPPPVIKQVMSRYGLDPT